MQRPTKGELAGNLKIILADETIIRIAFIAKLNIDRMQRMAGLALFYPQMKIHLICAEPQEKVKSSLID